MIELLDLLLVNNQKNKPIMKKQIKFNVYDSLGYYVASFRSYQDAMSYKMLVAQRPDWSIKENE